MCRLGQIVEDQDNRFFCFVQGEPDKDFVRKELMSILQDPQVTPKWVSKWKELRIIFVSLLAYKNHILVSSLAAMQ